MHREPDSGPKTPTVLASCGIWMERVSSNVYHLEFLYIICSVWQVHLSHDLLHFVFVFFVWTSFGSTCFAFWFEALIGVDRGPGWTVSPLAQLKAAESWNPQNRFASDQDGHPLSMLSMISMLSAIHATFRTIFLLVGSILFLACSQTICSLCCSSFCSAGGSERTSWRRSSRIFHLEDFTVCGRKQSKQFFKRFNRHKDLATEKSGIPKKLWQNVYFCSKCTFIFQFFHVFYTCHENSGNIRHNTFTLSLFDRNDRWPRWPNDLLWLCHRIIVEIYVKIRRSLMFSTL